MEDIDSGGFEVKIQKVSRKLLQVFPFEFRFVFIIHAHGNRALIEHVSL